MTRPPGTTAADRAPELEASARVVRASVVALVIAVTVGVGAALMVVAVAAHRHHGCVRTLVDGQPEWECPDGIGYFFPAVTVMALTGLVSLVAAVRVEFRRQSALARRRTATTVFVVVAVALTVGGSVACVAGARAGSSAGCEIGGAVTACGVGLIAFRGRAGVSATIAVVTVVVLAVAAQTAVLLAPALVVAAAYLLAAVGLVLPPVRGGSA